ncbi:MAG: hypothetical protein Q8L88_03095 [Bacteroidota bacterium]|nr:hypothetical protein [Bacteroidota bacterium]
MYLEESFEVFGYDATVMLLTAISNLYKKDISRNEIINGIFRQSEDLKTCYQYTFVDKEKSKMDGENSKNRYYCYSLNGDSIACSYEEDAINTLLKKFKKDE